MIHRRHLLAAAVGLSAASARAQGSTRPARIGILGATTATGYASRWNALREGLRVLGHVEGRNLVIDSRWADGRNDRLPALALELVQLKPDVLVTHGIPGTQAAKRATGSIPIVMAVVTDPVAAGLVESFARPGGNITGSSWFAPELAAKRLELLREVLPRLPHTAVLINADNPAFSQAMLQAMEATATRLGIRLQPFEVRGPADFDAAFAAMAERKLEAVAVLEEAMLNANPGPIAALARRHRMASVGSSEFAQAGGMLGYGADHHALFQRAAYFVDRLLKGARVADLPIEQASKFELTVNQGTARMLRITMPQLLLLRADRTVD